MSVDASDVKARISLRDLFERDGHVLKRSGSSLVCLSPFGQEKTPSCYVHEKEGFFKDFSTGLGGDCFVYWQETRKVDFSAAIAALASIAGLAPGLTPGPVVMVKQEIEEELAPPIHGEAAEKWAQAVADFGADEAEQQRTAEWRGYTVETVRWAIGRGLMGVLPVFGERRVAFPVERPFAVKEDQHLLQVAYHVRLGPQSQGNPHPRASWRFIPAGCGSWPFVVGDVSRSEAVFALEGQWDALSFLEVMGWTKEWPKSGAVVGMRGATSWKRFLKHYSFAKGATLFLLAQSDDAGQRWFGKDGFASKAWEKFDRVYGFRMGKHGARKDFNDMAKAGEINGPALSERFRRKLQVKPGFGKPKSTKTK